MGVYSGVRPNMLLEGSSVDFENAGVCNGSILELAVECERNDMRMFESVIELDFMEAYQKSVLEAEGDNGAGEAAKKSIKEKIKEGIKKAIETVKRFFADIISKIKNLIANDRKLVADYGKYWNEIHLVGFKVTDYVPVTKFESKSILDEFIAPAMDVVDKLTGTLNGNAIEELTGEYQKTVDTMLNGKDMHSYVDAFFFGKKVAGETEFADIQGQIAAVMDFMKDGKSAIALCKRECNTAIANLKKLEADIKFDKSREKKAGNDVAALNAQYKTVNATIKNVSKASSAISSSLTRALSQSRRVFIQGTRYAKNRGDKNIDARNEAMDIMLGIASDAYVESVMYEYAVGV